MLSDVHLCYHFWLVLAVFMVFSFAYFRVGISKFYSGKSKSFTSLADASSISTIEDLAKPENPYNRKRKSLLTQSSRPLRNNASGIPKKHIDFSQSALILGATMRKSKENFNLISSPSGCLPPQHPQTKVLPRNASSSSSSLPPQQNPPWRSFSLSDLQCVVGTDPVEWINKVYELWFTPALSNQ